MGFKGWLLVGVPDREDDYFISIFLGIEGL